MTPGDDATEQETARIRSVYRRRDSRGPRHPAIVAAYDLINQDRLAQMQSLITGLIGGSSPTILDVGCGSGFDLAYWLSKGWAVGALHGVDLVAERVREAQVRCPGVDLRVTSGSTLPFADDSFDVATAVTVFSSILSAPTRQRLFQEMNRVVRPGGIVVIYDFAVARPGNRDVIPIRLQDLRALGTPLWSVRLTPLLHAVAAGASIGGFGARIAMRLAPRTHRLTVWRMSGLEGPIPVG